MTAPVTLHGYRFSVYHRIARMALAEKAVDHAVTEVDPFDPALPATWVRMHPFGRVPVLAHGDFHLYETAAITRYIDAAFPGPVLTPTPAKALARMAQVIAIADNYGYRPLVRQVFAHGVFRPANGQPGDPTEVATGLEAAVPVLSALDRIAEEGLILTGTAITLADCHLAPMIAYFTAAPDGARALDRTPALAAWWDRLSRQPSVRQTDPGLPNSDN
ncbi:MAG: glutathione S-transferase family protein [Pseudomonadota bacterium]